MLQNVVFPLKLVFQLILDQIVDRAGVKVRELTHGHAELGETLAASVS